jgi:uncharacterized membrane protein HdeD (DUF308 family)
MIQLYFLSILCNSLCGYILFDGNEGENLKKNETLNNPTFLLVLGILSIVTGVLKILSPTMDRLPILGDFVPAVAGIAGGLLMVFGISRKEKSSPSPGSLEVLGVSLLRFRKPLGLGLLAAALLHFLFPNAIFL